MLTTCSLFFYLPGKSNSLWLLVSGYLLSVGVTVVDSLVELVANQNAFVVDAVADQGSVADDAAIDELGKTDELAELALEVELVAFLGYKVNIAFAGVDKLEKIVDINVAE